MSKIIKGVKKIFKKVVKVVKKVLPIILAAAAIYFTAGAALGATAAWGGTGGFAAGITSSLGSGVLGSTVTGALTSAGYGAAIGGVTSAALGGSFSQGAKTGAITGAVTGGVTGAVKGFAAAKDVAGGVSGPPAPTPDSVKTFPLPDSPGFTTDIPGTDITQLAGAGGLKQTGDEVVKAGFFEEGGWLERNPEIAGGAVKGIGQGLIAYASADSDRDYIRERFRLTAENYAGTDPGANYRDLKGSTERKDRYDPRSYGSWEYEYDATQGRIIKVPVGG